jgi:hypothetical protein
METERFTYWYPRRILTTGHFPAWTILFPPFWPMLLLAYTLWLVAIVAWFVISVPVNLVRLAVYAAHQAPTAHV